MTSQQVLASERLMPPTMAHVLHSSSDSTVSFDLPARARGASPFFMTRASGPALVLGRVRVFNRSMATASFALHLPGTYHVEVLLLFEHFDFDAFEHTFRGHDTYPGGHCMRLNDVVHEATLQLHARANLAGAGHHLAAQWIHEEVGPTSLLRPAVQTRWQLLSTGPGDYAPNCSVDNGMPIASLQRYASYRWGHINQVSGAFVASTVRNATRGGGVCLLGASHARKICAMIEDCIYFEVRFFTSRVHYARNTTNGASASIMRNVTARIGAERLCDQIVVTTGQWDGGFPMHRLTSLRMFSDELAASVRLLRQLLLNISVPIGLSLMTTNYNPPNCQNSLCPATDWRAPPVIDAYNAKIQELAVAESLRLVNLEPIIGPVWDAASDWCHPDLKVLEAEATAVLDATQS